MNSALMAAILCFMGVISIFIMPRFARWWYESKLKGKENIKTDSEYADAEHKKYTLPLRLVTWGYRTGGILIIAIAAFIYFSDFLG